MAKAGALPWPELSATYGRLFMEGLALLGTRRKHVNAEGAASDGLPEEGPVERGQAGAPGPIEDYRIELVPLIVPLTPLKHHLSRNPVPAWVHLQVYLNPYPKELMLRSHV